MIIETRSTINTPIISDESIVLVNPTGDLIIDAPIVSRKKNITLIAKNIFITFRGKLVTEANGNNVGNMHLQASESIYMEGDVTCSRNCTVEAKNLTQIGGRSRKYFHVQNILGFDHSTLRHVVTNQSNNSNSTPDVTTSTLNVSPVADSHRDMFFSSPEGNYRNVERKPMSLLIDDNDSLDWHTCMQSYKRSRV
ncbi:MAG: hypothetical protein V4501_02995 [Pseudomonadota bacterium]